MKRAICVGINDYPGTQNDLRQCVKDMNNWADYLSGVGFQVMKIADGNATKDRVCDELRSMLTCSSVGDHLVFTYSGHGSQYWDSSGDEEDGYDECICLHDADLIDDEIRDIFDWLPAGVSLTAIFDSCFGGTVSRFLPLDLHKARFRPPLEPIPSSVRRKKPFMRQMSEEEMPEVILTGCADNEYSYESSSGGVFTVNALDILRNATRVSYDRFAAAIGNRLPTDWYPQTPQVEGSAVNREKMMFAEGETEPPPPPPPEEEEGGCTCFKAARLAYLKLKRWMQGRLFRRGKRV